MKKKRRKPTTIKDPSKPIKNPRWEGFAQSIFSGKTQSDAYRKHYKCTTKKNKTIHESASRLYHKVAARVEWLQSQVADDGIMTKKDLAKAYSKMFNVTIADFLTLDQDGEMFVQVTEESMASMALKKVKLKKIVDESGNVVIGIHFCDLELESKVAIGTALQKIMGYDKKDENDEDAINVQKRFLDMVLARNADREKSPLTG